MTIKDPVEGRGEIALSDSIATSPTCCALPSAHTSRTECSSAALRSGVASLPYPLFSSLIAASPERRVRCSQPQATPGAAARRSSSSNSFASDRGEEFGAFLTTLVRLRKTV